jgi:hypothetical protein
MWFVPLTNVLDAHGLQAIKPFAFASSAVAAFISPLFFGAMADRHASPVAVMRWLAVGTSAAMTLANGRSCRSFSRNETDRFPLGSDGASGARAAFCRWWTEPGSTPATALASMHCRDTERAYALSCSIRTHAGASV